VDYSGYGVLPMALDRQDTIMAVRVVEGNVQEDTINLHNVSDRFPTRALTASSSIDVAHDWSRYVLAAYRGLEQAKDLVGTASVARHPPPATHHQCPSSRVLIHAHVCHGGLIR
jgi:galactokinase